MVGVAGRSGGDRWTEGCDRTSDDGGPLKPALPDEVGKKWDELIGQMPAGSLRRIDGHQIKILAELLALADVLSVATLADPSDHKTIRAFLNVTAQIHRASSVFGLSLGDRRRLAIAPVVDEEDGFAAMLKRRGTMPMRSNGY